MVKLGIRDLAIAYGGAPALEGVSFDVHEHEIFGIIGPANAGKTSFLKAVNRMDLFDSAMRVDGEITFNGVDVHKVRNVYGLRMRVGYEDEAAVCRLTLGRQY
jgi:phosphate transport system ATP-binding protein